MIAGEQVGDHPRLLGDDAQVTTHFEHAGASHRCRVGQLHRVRADLVEFRRSNTHVYSSNSSATARSTEAVLPATLGSG